MFFRSYGHVILVDKIKIYFHSTRLTNLKLGAVVTYFDLLKEYDRKLTRNQLN